MQSELQKAANRVREIQQAVTNAEAALVVCHTAVTAAKINLDNASVVLREEYRNLADTESLLQAQRQKLSRELHEMRELSYQAEGKLDKDTVDRAYEGLLIR